MTAEALSTSIEELEAKQESWQAAEKKQSSKKGPKSE